MIGNRDVAYCTNIERKVLQMMDGGCHLPLGVYCEKDDLGHFHVWAAKAEDISGPIKTVRLSSGTRHGLVEQIVEGLKGGLDA